MNREILYKYRSVQNWKFVLDIFLNKRLYAATYRELNDPMEGRYYYQNDEVSRDFREVIRNEKRQWRICSFSSKHQNSLMWSYYADGHRGLAVGVRIKNSRNHGYVLRKVQYNTDIKPASQNIRRDAQHFALHILSQKQSNWQHEDEVRVFTHDQFVEIDIQQVYIGYYMSTEDYKLIARLANIAAPHAQVIRLDRNNFDLPINTFDNSTNSQLELI